MLPVLTNLVNFIVLTGQGNVVGNGTYHSQETRLFEDTSAAAAAEPFVTVQILSIMIFVLMKALLS